MALIEDIYTLSPGTIVELYQVDASAVPNGSPSDIYYFHDGTNDKIGRGSVIWNGQAYSAFPVEVTGFEASTQGTPPKPSFKIANVDGVIGSLNRTLDDLVGAKVTRVRTLAKYLDAVNFTSGNAFADPTQSFADDVFYVNRKISENRIFVEYELASIFDLEGIKLPRRQIIQNVCSWGYRSSECSYSGGDVADEKDNLVGSPAYSGSDVCGKKLASCKLRFPAVSGVEQTLPFGGFPGAGLF